MKSQYGDFLSRLVNTLSDSVELLLDALPDSVELHKTPFNVCIYKEKTNQWIMKLISPVDSTKEYTLADGDNLKKVLTDGIKEMLSLMYINHVM